MPEFGARSSPRPLISAASVESKLFLLMKSIQLTFITAMAFILPASSQDKKAAAPGEAATSSLTTARVLGNLADGTPPAPEPPKAGFAVPARNILSSIVYEQGGRKITVQEITPIALKAPTAPLLDQVDPAIQQRLAELRKDTPQNEMMQIGATVFRSKDSPPRTYATYHPNGGEKPITFWSSADFALFSGFSSFLGSDGKTRNLMMMWSTRDAGSALAIRENQAISNTITQIPDFPEGKATFIITSENSTPESLAAIQSLHDVYNNEFERLKAAYAGREKARLDQSAELKAHPPKPKDITLNFWRIGESKPAQEKGAGQ